MTAYRWHQGFSVLSFSFEYWTPIAPLMSSSVWDHSLVSMVHHVVRRGRPCKPFYLLTWVHVYITHRKDVDDAHTTAILSEVNYPYPGVAIPSVFNIPATVYCLQLDIWTCFSHTGYRIQLYKLAPVTLDPDYKLIYKLGGALQRHIILEKLSCFLAQG
jgi:hypothetical protein